jgi:DNA-binding CsgD family transcriptional regulator/tetratricopeptide (TPR) repeat protein
LERRRAVHGGALVGRAGELAVVDGALDATGDGGALALQVSGDPGIGKTALLGELGRRGEARGRLVLVGRASELESDLPYGIFVDALDEYLQTLDAGWLASLDHASDGELARMFPTLPGGAATAGAVLDERYRAHRAVQALLAALAEERPLVFLLDDLHWADPASIDLVAALLRRPPRAPVLTALALRTRQAPARLASALETAARNGQLERIELGPLRRSDVGALVGTQVRETDARALYDESGGNPFYLEQLLRAGPSPGAGRTTPGAGIRVEDVELPQAIAVTLAEELGRLSPGARTLLDAAAVVGDPFELDLAAASADVDEPAALAALDELLDATLLLPTDAPRRFRFRHPILRRAVHDTTRLGWRGTAHRRAADALEERGAPAVARAHHVVHFAAAGDRKAIDILREAADASAERAPESAARWYRVALELLPPSAEDRPLRLRLLERLADVLSGSGRFPESHAVLEELLELAPPDAPERRRAVVACARVEHALGRHEDAHRRLVSALERSRERTSPEAVTLLLDLGMDAFYRREYEQMREWGLEAHATVTGIDTPQLRAAAGAMVSVADAFTGRVNEARAYRDEAAALVDSLPDELLALRLNAVANLGNAETYLDRLHDAVGHLDRGLAVGRATGQGHLFPLLMQRKGFALSLLGRLDDAVEVLDHAVEQARLSESPQAIAWALLNRSWVATMVGDLDTALAAAEESVSLGRRLDDNPVLTWSACALGSALVESGEPERCLETLVPAGGGDDLPRIPGVLRCIFQERVTQALLAVGRLDDADRVARSSAALARELDLDLARAMAARARASVALARRDAEEALEAARDSAVAAERMGARIEAARSHALAGRVLAASGRREEAIAAREHAAAELAACGANRYREDAERELRRLGKRVRRRSATAEARSDLAGLTGRELQVARLVVERKTNAEIAGELFLSQKTVESHLRSSFRKLGVSSRAELARAVKDASARD